jgi:hypothetical protein
VYLLLFGLSVRWYLPADRPSPLWLGLPYWVVISLAAVLAIEARGIVARAPAGGRPAITAG